MNKMMLQKVMLTSLSVMFIGTSAGVGIGKPVSADSDIQASTKDTLKVLYWNADDFNRTYGKQFNKDYPDTDIEVFAPTGTGSITDYNSAIQKYSPDLVMLPPMITSNCLKIKSW